MNETGFLGVECGIDGIISPDRRKIEPLRLFYKEKIGDKRVVHILGLKICYRKKHVINPESTIDHDAIREQIGGFFDSGVTDVKREKKIIVSITSIPSRMSSIHFALFSVLRQNLKPDEVVLWLGEEKFPGKREDLPPEVLSLEKNGLKIKWCKDIGPHTKLIPALKNYPNDIVVTADDDIYYPPDWLELLYDSYLKNPECIHCHRAHRVSFDRKGRIAKYSKWKWEISDVEPSVLNFITGVGGVLYPPGVFYKDVFDENVFGKLTPTNDDIWFWAMAALKGTKINVVHGNIKNMRYVNIERERGYTGEYKLGSINLQQNKNDDYMRNMVMHYPQIQNINKRP